MASQRATEETPLLPETTGAEVHRPNRISRLQIGLILLVSLAENLSPQVLYPFMPDLVANLDITHGDASKVSFYMGVERALFFTTLSLTTLTWNRASDRLGRKPILLAGSGGAALSLYATGLTRRSYRWLIVSRCFGGFFNGNVGILKSIMAEMSADSNQLAELFSYLPLAWAGTGLFGPLIGGSLARPAEQFPGLFGSNKFLKAYPYFLPCAVNASFLVFACVMCYTFLKETLKNPQSFRQWLGLSSRKNPAQTSRTSPEDVAESAATPADSIPESERPYPILGLLRTRRVLIVAINFTCLSISQASLNTFQPLQLSLPVDKGGMNFAPPLVGKILSTFGLLNGALQFFFFAKIHAYMGPKWFFTIGTACGIPMIMSFPLTNYLVRSSGNTGLGVWALIAVQTLAKVGINMSSGALFIVVAAAAPNKASLGATMGICSTIGSLMRAYGPAMTNTIFAISLEKNILAGNLVYIFLFITTSITLATASFLPQQLWNKDK